MVIREAKISDASAIAKVHVDTRRTTYKGIIPEEQLLKRTYEDTEKRWANRIGDPHTSEFIFVAENNEGEIVGFTSTSTNSEEDGFDSILSTLYISEDYQMQGIGQSLIRVAANKLKQQHVKSLIVWVFAENPSKKFYERLGGKLVKEKMVNQGKSILEVAYGWDDIEKLRSLI
jgi:L-amino acid N-acyltransferase YncA